MDTLPTWLQTFLDRLAADDLSAATRRGYRYDLRHFIAWYTSLHDAAPELARLTEHDLITWRQHMMTQGGLKAASINRRLEAVRRLLRWAEANGTVARNVAIHVKSVRIVREPRPLGLTAAQVHGLLRAAGESSHGLARRNYALVQLMLQTGLRVGEVAALRRRDVVLRERAGTVRVRNGKGLKEREVPLNATARRTLRQLLEQEPAAQSEAAVFRSGHSPVMPVRSIQNVVAALVRRAGLTGSDITAQQLRQLDQLAWMLAQPGERDVLLRDWSLTKGDLREIQRARSQGRLWTALHLCSLRRTGRFADDPERIPHEAIVHLAGQIGIHPPARLAVLPRQATDSAIRNRVRESLGFVSFSADAEAHLTASLAELALDGLGSAELVERAEAFLLAAHVVLPARAALERLVASLNRQALEALFTRIAVRFSVSTRAAFDRLLGNAGDGDAEPDSRATVGQFRTPPASSLGRFTRTAGERLEEINALLRDLPDLSDISHRVLRQLADLCRRYDGHALRRFPAAKRYSLLACFLLDRRQGLLDDMVQAHDNHMTGLMRRARHAAEADARQLRQAAEAGLVTLIDTGEAVFTGDREESVAGLRERIGADRLEGALMACRAVATNDARGVVDAVIARYPDLRKSLPAFWSLPFASDTGHDCNEQLDAAANAVLALIDARKFDEAEQAAHDVLARFPGVHDGHECLGRLYQAKGDHQQAAECYRKVIAFARDEPHFYHPHFIDHFQDLIDHLETQAAKLAVD